MLHNLLHLSKYKLERHRLVKPSQYNVFCKSSVTVLKPPYWTSFMKIPNRPVTRHNPVGVHYPQCNFLQTLLTNITPGESVRQSCTWWTQSKHLPKRFSSTRAETVYKASGCINCYKCIFMNPPNSRSRRSESDQPTTQNLSVGPSICRNVLGFEDDSLLSLGTSLHV